MSALHVSLFGKLEVTTFGQKIGPFGSAKAEELFCYLMLNRDRPHPREALASLLWCDCTTSQSRAYLRKTIWHIQQLFGEIGSGNGIPALRVEPQWLRFDTCDQVWIDVAELEQAFALVRGKPGREMDGHTFRQLQSAVKLYRSDLLESWYQEWCLQRRERLQYMYLAMLDKLTDYCEVHGLFEIGIDYCDRILAVDEAREHTHRRLMLLRYFSGDRTGAIRQYDRCRQSLRAELSVSPSQKTDALLADIKSDALGAHRVAAGGDFNAASLPVLWSHLDRIKTLQQTLVTLQAEIRDEIAAVEAALQR